MRKPPNKQLALAAAQLGEALYTRMQEPGFEQAIATAFAASPKEIGAAAVEAARRRLVR